MEMDDFITVMRAKRQLEMKQYREKGYVIQNPRDYILLDKIELEYMGEKYEYSVQFTQNEIHFYINKNGGNIYLSIAEIYQLLRNLKLTDGGYLSGRLNAQLYQKKNKTIEFVNYDGLKCEMTEPVKIDKIYDVSIPQTGISVTNAELFLLILLIQEKSNALFRKSKGVKKQFVNGLIRMLIVLVEYKNDDDLLSSLGWRWDSKTEMYEFVSLSSRKGRERQKYYLTRQEFTDRIEAKKS